MTIDNPKPKEGSDAVGRQRECLSKSGRRVKSLADPQDEFCSQSQHEQCHPKLEGLKLDDLLACNRDRPAELVDARSELCHAKALNCNR